MKLDTADVHASAALFAGAAALPFAIFFALGTLAANSWARSPGSGALLEEQYPDPHLGI